MVSEREKMAITGDDPFRLCGDRAFEDAIVRFIMQASFAPAQIHNLFLNRPKKQYAPINGHSTQTSFTDRLMPSNNSQSPDAFTRRCRDLIRTFTYEDIVACTMYAPPMLFMLGPAAIVANDPLMTLVLQAIVGFALSGMLHRTGHRLLMALPKEPRQVYLTRSLTLPAKLTLSQFLLMLQMMVAAAVFSGILSKRCFLAGDTYGFAAGSILFAVGVSSYLAPVYLAKLWIERYYPAMTLVGPTDDVIKQSFPSRRSLFRYLPFV